MFRFRRVDRPHPPPPLRRTKREADTDLSRETWTELVSCAVAGTSKRAPKALPELDKESAALTQAAVLATCLRSGYEADRGDAAIQESPTDIALPVVNGARHLRRCLELSPELALEWLRIAKEAKVSVPYPLLPDILTFGAAQNIRREAVIATIGNRGKWLASLNPDWSYVVESEADDGKIWQIGSTTSRIAALKRLRRQNAAATRDLIQQSFSQEPAEFRSQIVGVLSEDVTIQDEPFLRTLLTDRSQEVRQAAVRALTKLQGSFTKEIEAQVFSLIKFTKNFLRKTFEVEPPPITEAPRKDPKNLIETLAFAWPKPFPGRGWRESLLTEMIGLVPPANLTRHLKISPEEIIQYATKHIYKEALISGLSTGTRLFGDPVWAEALVRHSGYPIFTPVLVQVLPLPARERLIAELVSTSGSGIMTSVYALDRWSPELSQEMISWCGRALTNGGTYLDPLAIAVRLHPSTYEAALNLIDEKTEHRIGVWNETLPLLNDMRQTIRNNP